MTAPHFVSNAQRVVAQARFEVAFASLQPYFVTKKTIPKLEPIAAKVQDIVTFVDKDIKEADDVFKDQPIKKIYRFRGCTFTLKTSSEIQKIADEKGIEMQYYGCSVKELSHLSSSYVFRRKAQK